MSSWAATSAAINGAGYVCLATALILGGAGCSSGATGAADAGDAGDNARGPSGGGDGGGGASACTNRTRQVQLSDRRLADFEDGKLSDWYSFKDATPNAIFNMIAVAGPGAVGTTAAAHLSGTGFRAFGAGMGYGLRCRDVSVFDGVAFWARGRAGAGDLIAFQAVLPETHAVADNGDCLAKCHDHPSRQLTIGPEWKQYTVPFADLRQAGFGGVATYQGIVMALSWVSITGPDVDFWIDEVAFYQGPAGTGPVGASPMAGGEPGR